MPGQTNECALETYVEETLLTRGGWKSGSNAAVERLQEYRTALITAAVTGKMDVRNAIPAASSTAARG
ncbi:MAG: hypothetical protein L0Z50_13100 [Verrucomicrobiales bacterium]|nr:hypothetical protein [Verrucomicrobiales bacterium]